MGKFNLEEARKQAETFKRNNNFAELAVISIAFCDKGHYPDWLQKACFYLGRLNAFRDFKELFKRNFTIRFLVQIEDQELAIKCFDFGLEYEDLSAERRQEIIGYFQNPKYSNLFQDMMYDYKKYIGNIQSLGTNELLIRNNNFSQELISEIAELIEYNEDESYYYDRTSNDICQIAEFSDSVRGIHFYVEAKHRLDSGVKLILNSLNYDSIEIYADTILTIYGDKIKEISHAGFYKIGASFINMLIDGLSRKMNYSEDERIKFKIKVYECFAVDFLTHVNKAETTG